MHAAAECTCSFAAVAGKVVPESGVVVKPLQPSIKFLNCITGVEAVPIARRTPSPALPCTPHQNLTSVATGVPWKASASGVVKGTCARLAPVVAVVNIQRNSTITPPEKKAWGTVDRVCGQCKTCSSVSL